MRINFKQSIESSWGALHPSPHLHEITCESGCFVKTKKLTHDNTQPEGRVCSGSFSCPLLQSAMQTPVLQGPMLQRPVLQRPMLQRPRLQRPMLQAPVRTLASPSALFPRPHLDNHRTGWSWLQRSVPENSTENFGIHPASACHILQKERAARARGH